ncbi:hypothetical protein T310_6315, partial [Rasamsonia emersonii CBS 393.64]
EPTLISPETTPLRPNLCFVTLPLDSRSRIRLMARTPAFSSLSSHRLKAQNMPDSMSAAIPRPPSPPSPPSLHRPNHTLAIEKLPDPAMADSAPPETSSPCS